MNKQLKLFGLLFHSLFVTINVVVAILFIASAYSDRISPEINILPAYMGLAFPVFCAFNLCFAIYWLFLLKWKCLLITLVSFLVCWGPLGRYYTFHTPTKVPEESVIKILTYNVMAFGYRDHTEEDPNLIVKYIADSGADIVCLQEYGVWNGSKYLNRTKLKKAFGKYAYHSESIFNTVGNVDFGIAIYSKFPITSSHRISYESSNNGSTMHEININGKKMILVNNHLESFKLTTEDRSRYSAFIKNIGTSSFDTLKGTIERKLGPAFKKRAKQAEIVKKELRAAKGDYFLVCGDFNDTPISYAHRTIQGDDLIDSFSESGYGMGSSYNQNYFWFRIDYILHSPNMKSINCTVGKVRYSDHYPLWCYMKLE